MHSHPESCDVTFAMACYNAQPFLDAAISSALSQTDVAIEIVIVDDGSTDGSFEAAQSWQARDGRVRVYQTPRNLGPAGARNIALQQMQGRWYAVLDSDDLLAPGRTRELMSLAEGAGADLIADNLRIFGDGMKDLEFLNSEAFPEGRWVGLDDYFASTQMFGGQPNLGFLKPMIRKSFLNERQISYDESLRIGEDDELIVRILLEKGRYLVVPQCTYLYRKHGQSISHRLSLVNAERIMASERRIRQRLMGQGVLSKAYKARWEALVRAVAFTRAIDAIKKRQFLNAIAAVARSPASIMHFSMPIRARARRWLGS